jgi:predicted nucleotidyltransferase
MVIIYIMTTAALEALSQPPLDPLGLPPDALELHRFIITPESREMLNGIREQLPRIQEESPWVEGVGFFGSRTRGQENESSDLDVIVFYNSDFDSTNVVHERDVESLTDSVGATVNLHPFEDDHVKNVPFRYDISSTNLRNDIVKLEEAIQIVKDDGNDILSLTPRQVLDRAEDHGSDLGNLDYLFMLAVGDDVYKARKFVLDQLAQTPDGDTAIAFISNILNYKERDRARKKRPDTPDYDNYPTTIEAARKYYRTKAYSEEEFPTLSKEEVEKRLQADIDRLWEGREDPTRGSRVARALGHLRK